MVSVFARSLGKVEDYLVTHSGVAPKTCILFNASSTLCKDRGRFFCVQALGELRVTFPDPPDVRSSPSAAKGRCLGKNGRWRDVAGEVQEPSGLRQHVRGGWIWGFCSYHRAKLDSPMQHVSG